MLEGYPSVFDQEIDFGYFRESVAKGAFETSLKDDEQVLLHAHDSANVMSSTPDNMTLKENDHGLAMEATLNKSSIARDVYEMVDAGDLNGMSIGFAILEERMVREDGKSTLYIIEKARLYEASTTPFPAYEGTEVNARAQVLSVETRERREKRDGEKSPTREQPPTPAGHNGVKTVRDAGNGEAVVTFDDDTELRMKLEPAEKPTEPAAPAITEREKAEATMRSKLASGALAHDLAREADYRLARQRAKLVDVG